MARDGEAYWQYRETDSYTRRTRHRNRFSGPPREALAAPGGQPAPPSPALLAIKRQPVRAAAPAAGPLPAAATFDEDDGLQDCRVGPWCRDATTRRDEDGHPTREPARTPRAACDACAAAVAEALPKLPPQYVHLAVEIGQPSRSDCATVHVPFGPSIPIRGDVDALMRTMVIVLASWHQRLAEVPALNLSQPPGPAENTGKRIVAAVRVLKERTGPLLALQPAMMPRQYGNTVDAWVDWPELDGGDAYAEILRLYDDAQRILGEVDPRPEELTGIRCYRCNHKALVRADPPAKDRDVVYHSRCRRCGHLMTWDEYRQHTKRLLAIAQDRPTLAS